MNDPKELAIKLIKPYVERGDSIKSLIDGQGGMGCSEESVSIGGYVWHNEKMIYKAKNDEIVVDRINNKDCLYIFKLKTLYDLINSGQQQLL